MKRPPSPSLRALIIGIYLLVFWLLLPAIMVVAARFCDARLGLRFHSPALRLGVGLPLAGVGLPLFARALVDFRRYGLEWPISALPAGDIVQKGLYTYWRHPIYLFFTLSAVAIGWLTGSGGLLAIVLPAFILIELAYVRNEERILLRRFGARYERYRRRTPLVLPRLATLLRPLFGGLCRALFSIEARGRERLPAEPPFILIAAHRSYLDAFFISWAVRVPACFVATYEMFRTPAKRFVFSRFLCIPKRRFRNDAETGRQLVRRLGQGFPIGIFPEGERSWTGATSGWKPEVLSFLRRYPDIPVIPVRLDGNYLAWPRWAKRWRRARVTVTFQSPFRIPPEMPPADLERELRARVEPDDASRTVRARPNAEGIAKVLYRCPDCLSGEALRRAGRAEWICGNCGLLMRLRPDYRVACVRDGCESLSSLPALHERIRLRAAEFARPGAGEEYLVAEASEAVMAEERAGRLVPAAQGRLRLTNRQLAVGDRHRVRLEDVRSVTTESNFRLQIYDGPNRRLWEIRTPHDSVLKWQEALLEVIQHEYHRLPNHR